MEQKYTTLAQEALGDAVQSASAAGNPQVEPLHLLDSLLRQENGVIGGLIEAVGANRQTIGAQVRNALVSLPSASGSSTAQASASRQLTTALADASKEMKDMGDEYISTEHLLLGILDAAPNEAAKILEQNGITADKVRAAIPNVRGGAKVTSPDAEASYKALEKFSTDLTARAREGKLDPVIGRDQEIRRVIQILSRRTKNNPVLIGEPGVGKTELAKALAEFLFDDEKAMIRIDMSEYMEKSSVSRLIGAAPGYVGYEEGGQLTEAVRRRPYSVVLFDEVEKANSEVFDILLQVLDDGRLTDGQGRTVDFKNTILIMTSNLGSQFLVNPDLDEQQKKDAVMNAVHSQFRPEFLNRLDDMVIFHPLTRQELGKIVDLQVKQVASRLTDRRITLDVTEAAREWLADTGYDPAYGARPLRRLVQTEVGDQLARMLLAGEIKDGDTVLVDHTGGEHLELTDHTHNPMEGDPNPGDSQITVDDKKDDGEQKDA